MARKEPLYPHVPKSQKAKGEPESEQAKRRYTPPELAEIARIFYEAQASRSSTVFAFIPIYRSWASLDQSQRDETISGLQERIERESLKGYLERKRPQIGEELTEAIIHQLERGGYL